MTTALLGIPDKITVNPNPDFDTITVGSAIIGSTDPLNPTNFEGYFDTTNAVFTPPFGGYEPLPIMTQIVRANKGGSDITGDGTNEKPYLSVGYAMSTITDALTTKRYVILTGPGDYDENISLKAWVFVVGYANLSVRFNGTIDINDPSWSLPGSFDQRAGFSRCVFRNPVIDFNFVTANSLYGKIYLQNVDSNNVINFVGFGPVNQAYVFGGFIFGGILTQGVNLTTTAAVFQGGSVSAISSPNAPTILLMTACIETGNLVVSATLANAVTCTLYESFIMNLVNVSGASASLRATCGSLPRQANISVTGGANLMLLNDAAGVAYTPSSPPDWPLPIPTTVQEALDDLASTAASPIVSVDPTVVAFPGGGQSPSYQITDYFTNVAVVATVGDSVVLPASVVGTTSKIKNNSVNAMDVFPPVGSSLNALAVNTPISLLSSSSIEFVCTTTINWQSLT